ncbi:hypothetical protein ACI2KR_06490 [Pseudomonas luteola]
MVQLNLRQKRALSAMRRTSSPLRQSSQSGDSASWFVNNPSGAFERVHVKLTVRDVHAMVMKGILVRQPSSRHAFVFPS